MALPAEGEKDIVTIEGRRLRLRPIGPDDDDALIDMARRSTPDDLRLRFFSAVRPEPGPLVSSLTHYDHDRQRAAGAYDPALPRGAGELLGVVRLHWEPDLSRGECAIIVRSDFKSHGLGHCLMAEMLGWAVDLGLARVDGDVLPENSAMLRMVRSCGGVILPRGPDLHTVRVTFDPPRRI
ncbi:MAG: GCN5-related N-acetyltransferase [Caulobacteraceae bacterium]|nr:GCN5-related N-acetyltransferase [Caulobacteraceae bacterium]